MTLDYTAIGKRIRGSRKQAGMTQARLSEKVGISPSHMSHIESGKTKVSLPVLVDIANTLETTVDQLLHDNVELTRQAYDLEFRKLLQDCSADEKHLIYTAASQLKDALNK